MRITKALDNGFQHLEKAYARGLNVILRHRFATLLVFLITMVAADLYATASTGFFPPTRHWFFKWSHADLARLLLSENQGENSTSCSVISQDPDVSGFGLFVGQASVNQANLYIALKPKGSGRDATADEIITRLRPKLAQLVGVQTFFQAAQDINVGGRAGQAQYQYTLAEF